MYAHVSPNARHRRHHCPCSAQVPTLRPRQYAQVSKRVKTVQRAYGGSRCANCVRERIVRAFLVEEAKIVKRVRLVPPLPLQSLRESVLPLLRRRKDADSGTVSYITGHCPAAAGQEVDEFVGNLDLFFIRQKETTSLCVSRASERTGSVESSRASVVPLYELVLCSSCPARQCFRPRHPRRMKAALLAEDSLFPIHRSA